MDAALALVHTRTLMAEQGLGFRFYAGLAGLAVAIGIAVLVGALIFFRALYAWGFFGMFLFLAVVLVLLGWLTDRRQARRRYVDD